MSSTNIDPLKYNNKEMKRFAMLLFMFFFSTVLPQMIYLTREDFTGTLIKAFLTLALFVYVLYRAANKQRELNIFEMLIAILLSLTQIVSNWLFSFLNIGITVEGIISISISFLYYILFMSVLSSEKINRKGIFVFIDYYKFFLLYACILNLIINSNNILGITEMSSSYEYNFSSFFSNRNTFALFLLVGVMICIYSMSVRKVKSDKIIFLIIIVNIFLTFSRAALLGALVFIVSFYLLNTKAKLSKKIILLLFSIITLLLLSANPSIKSFFLDNIIRTDVGTTGRAYIWKEVWEVFISNNIFFGVGQSIARYYTIHNSFLTILAYGGISLAVFYAFLIYRTFAIDIIIYKKDRQTGAFFISALITFLVISNAETIMPFMSNALNTIYTIIIILVPRYYINMLVKN